MGGKVAEVTAVVEADLVIAELGLVPHPEGGWYPEQRLSVEEAIWGFTGGVAHAAGASDEQGKLAPGYLADIAVLSDDPFKVDPSALHRIGAEITLLEGKVVWEKQ